MALILAIETDARQAALLRWVVRDRIGARLVVVSSKEQALAAIAAEIPDLVLVSALLSPRDEEEIVAHLRTLDGAAHLQTLTIPRLADRAQEEPGGWRRFWRRRRAVEAMTGCDPHRFGDAIAEYLARAEAIRNEHAWAATMAAPQTQTASPAPDGATRPPEKTAAASQDPDARPAPTALPHGPAGPRPAPLAIWARRPKPAGDLGDRTPTARILCDSETRAILAALQLPPGVADVGIHGCRIRRVIPRPGPLASSARSGRGEPFGGESLHAVA